MQPSEPEAKSSRNVIALRRLIVAEIVLILLSVFAGFFEERNFPSDVKAFVDAETQTELRLTEWAFAALSLPYLALFIASWVTLWRLKRVGRLLYTLVWAFSAPVYFIVPVQICGPASSLLADAAVLTAGVVFGLIYFSDLRAHFGSNGT